MTSPAFVPTTLGVLGGFVVLAIVVGWLGSALVQRLSNPVGRYRRLYVFVLLPVAAVAYVGLSTVGLGASLVAAVPMTPRVIEPVLAGFVDVLGAGLVWLGGYAPTVAGVRRVRGIDYSTGRALWRAGRFVVGLSLIVTAVLAPFHLPRLEHSAVALAVGFAVVTPLFVYLSPWIIPLLRETTIPDVGTAQRLSRLTETAGLDGRDTVVLETDAEETAEAFVRGPPGYRRVFVTTTFLDRFDDETARALLAIEAGRRRARVLETRTVTAVIGGLLLIGAVAGIGPRWPLLGAAFVVAVIGCRRSRTGIRLADDHAAAVTSPGAVARALDLHADVHGVEVTRRRIPNPLAVTVPLGDRLDRLVAKEPA